MVGSLAWPVAVIGLVLLLRIPLTRTILGITHLKYKDLELDFGRELKQLETEAKAIDITPLRPKPIPPTRKDPLRLFEDAARVVQDFPVHAIALGWQAVGVELGSAVNRLAGSPNQSPDNSWLKNAQLLKDEKLLDQRTFDLLIRMRALRDLAVHGPGISGVGVTTDEALEFLGLATGVVQRLQALSRS
jgi:hypothetical protein